MTLQIAKVQFKRPFIQNSGFFVYPEGRRESLSSTRWVEGGGETPGRGHWDEQADKFLEPGLEQWPRMERGNGCLSCLRSQKNKHEHGDERKGGSTLQS